MSKKHMVTLHHIITVNNDMFILMDGVMRAIAKKMTQWMEYLYFALKLARQKLSQYLAAFTPMTGMRLVSAHILYCSRKLQSFRKWDKAMDINPEDVTSYTNQFQQAFLKYVENEYYAKHLWMSIIRPEKVPGSNLLPFGNASGFGQSSLIHMICPAMMKNTWCVNAWLKRH